MGLKVYIWGQKAPSPCLAGLRLGGRQWEVWAISHMPT